jgi:hypothetical protein
MAILAAVLFISPAPSDSTVNPTAVSYPFSDSNGTTPSVPSYGDLVAEAPISHSLPGQGQRVQKFANKTVFNATVPQNVPYSLENLIIKNGDRNGNGMWLWVEVRLSGRSPATVQDLKHEDGTMVLLLGEVYAICDIC